MKSNAKAFPILLVMVLLFSHSCRKLKSAPLNSDWVSRLRPLIDQQTGAINTGILMISYQDGDGDIGPG